uniref:ORF35 n=1 Tax=Malaco herpesvirus 1 TaxID=3031797 RepID=A0AA48SFG3_9VIRU|nr:TPA_asm: ORF35 [Malaco herpesvirus 1]
MALGVAVTCLNSLSFFLLLGAVTSGSSESLFLFLNFSISLISSSTLISFGGSGVGAGKGITGFCSSTVSISLRNLSSKSSNLSGIGVLPPAATARLSSCSAC